MGVSLGQKKIEKNVTNTCEKLFLASLTRRFVSAKRLFRDLSESNGTLVEHRAQSPVREFMLAVWPSIAEGFPTARSRSIYVTNIGQKWPEQRGNRVSDGVNCIQYQKCGKKEKYQL